MNADEGRRGPEKRRLLPFPIADRANAKVPARVGGNEFQMIFRVPLAVSFGELAWGFSRFHGGNAPTQLPGTQ